MQKTDNQSHKICRLQKLIGKKEKEILIVLFTQALIIAHLSGFFANKKSI